jgi:tetratricopeptide (TPR) repeat protein
VDHVKGTERICILRRLGSGSFGVVYEAFDQERQCKVALKVPHLSGPGRLQRFKQEFRVLADLAHPNLVNIFELVSHGQEWFVTTELVEGPTFCDCLNPSPEPGAAEAGERDGAPTLGLLYARLPLEVSESQAGFPAAPPSPWAPARPPRDYGQVRSLLRQLAEALWVFHQLGRLHQNIKPSNVRVAPGGRAVLLDLGLAPFLGGDPRQVGTPAFMAPELIGGQPPSQASDWYSVGVMLYQALTGQVPFPGDNLSTVIDKLRMDPPAPSRLLPQTPPDLDRLCMELLARKPAQRPSGIQVLTGLGIAPPIAPPPAAPAPLSGAGQPSLGRGEERERLRQALAASQGGRTAAAFLEGPPGCGKSHLLRRFLEDSCQGDVRAVILEGRCFPRAAGPFHGLEGLMEALGDYLAGLPPLKAASLLPRHLPSLCRLFPSLSRVEPVAAFRGGAQPPPDPQEQRRQALGALRELLGRIADRYPLVLALDDLHWADGDSAAVLASLLRSPGAPGLLLVATCLPEGGGGPHGLPERLAQEGAEVHRMSLAALPKEDARRMALARLGDDLEGAPSLAEAIADASEGNAFWISELSFQARLGGSLPEGGAERSAHLARRLAQLSSEDMLLLGLLALAGRPLAPQVLAEASGLGPSCPERLARLGAARLVRSGDCGDSGKRWVDLHHDMMPQAILACLDPRLVPSLHHRLAQGLEQADPSAAQLLSDLREAAGDSAKALEQGRLAADHAFRCLAFVRAAELYGRVLVLGDSSDPSGRDLQVKRADALAYAGQGEQAARAYLEALPRAGGREALRLRRRASEELFRSGHFQQGERVLDGALDAIGMTLPRSPRKAWLASRIVRTWLRLRGHRFQEHREFQIPQDRLDRVDICWAAALGLGPIDPARGGFFQAFHLLHALRAGEPFRVVRALAHETIHVAREGNRSLGAAQKLQALTLARAERIGHPNPMGRAFIAAGIAALLQGRWKAAVDLLDRAEGLLRESCAGLDAELHLAQFHGLLGHHLLGNLPELEIRLASRMQAARDKGDLVALTNLRTGVAPHLRLAKDDPEGALQEASQAMRDWTGSGFSLQRFYGLHSQVAALLYKGDLREAWALLQAEWEPLGRSFLLETQVVRVACLELRARVAFALAAGASCRPPERKALLRLARRDFQRLEAEGTGHGEAQGLKLQALEAMARGRQEEAAALLFQSEVAFQGCHMVLHAAAMRLTRGRLEGPAGEEHVESAERLMRSLGVADPVRYAAMHLPAVEPHPAMVD